MNNLPSNYYNKQRITKTALIKGLTDSKHKKIIKENVLTINLIATITGEDIPSVSTDVFNVQVITFIEIHIKVKKDLKELATALQKAIKNYVIITFIYEDEKILSFSLKRLNKNNTNEIVIDSSLLTTELPINDYLIDTYTDYNKIINKQNKILFYREYMIRTFLISNKYLYSDVELLLNSNLWYNNEKIVELYKLSMQLLTENKKRLQVKEQREIVEVNNVINGILERLEMLYE